MRIAFEATSLLDRTTGVARFVREVLARLALDDSIDVVAFGFTRIYLDELTAAVPAGVTVNRRPIPARTTRQLWLRFDRPLIDRWTGPVDLVHGPNFVVPPSAGVELMTIHDLTAVRFPSMCDDNTRQYPRLIRRALRRGAHVHAVSHAVAAEVVEEFGVAPDRVHVVHNGLTPPIDGDAHAGMQRAGGDRYVVAIGTIEPRKNFAALVRAFDAIATRDRDLRLVIAGGRGWGDTGIDDAIATAQHSDRIALLGRVDEQTRADLLAGATALAYPSVYEGFGLPPLEAMAAGVPVLTTAVGGIPEVVGDAALVVPLDDDALANGLERLTTDDELRATLRDRGRERAARYSWDRTAAELVELYRRLT